MHTRTQGKGSVTPQETEPDLPVSVLESPVEVWVDSGLLQGQGHWQQQSWEAWCVGISPLEGGHHSPTTEPIALPQRVKTLGWGHLRPNYREGAQPHLSAEN